MTGITRSILKWLLLSSGAVLLTVAVTLAACIFWLNYDNNNLKLALEEGLSRWLQRDLQIGQVVKADLGKDSLLVVHDIRLANPQWAAKQAFASAEYLELAINLPSIWQQGPVVIHQLVLQSLTLNLLAPEGKQATWDLWPEQDQTSNEEAPFPVFIGRGRIDQAKIIYRDPDQDLSLILEKARIDQQSGEEMLDMLADGTLNDRRLSIQGQVGPPRALLTGRQLTGDLNLELGQLSLRGSGSVADLSTLEALELTVKASSPISRPLLDMLGMQEVRDGPLQLDARLATIGSILDVDAVGKLGEFDLGLRGTVEQPGEVDGINAAFSVDGPSLKEAGAMFEVHTLPDVPYLLSGRVERQGSRLTLKDVKAGAGDTQLLISGQLPAFPSIDDWHFNIRGSGVNLALLGPTLGLEGIPDSSYQMAGNLRPSDSGIELIDLQVSNEKSQLVLNGVVGDGPGYFQTSLNFELTGENIAEMAPWLGLQKMPEQPFSLLGKASFAKDGWTLEGGQFHSVDLRVGLDAHIDRLINTRKIAGDISLASRDPMATLRAYGLESQLDLALPMTFEGRLDGSPDSLKLERGTLTVGDNKGKVSGDLGNLIDLERLRLQLGLSGPDLLQLYPQGPAPLSGPIPYQTSATLGFSREKMNISAFKLSLPDHRVTVQGAAKVSTSAPLNLSAEISANAESSQRLEALWTDQAQFLDSNLNLTASLNASDSQINITPLKLDAGHSDIEGKLALELASKPFLKAELNSERIYLPLLLPELEELEKAKEAPPADEGFDIDEFTDALTKQELKERIIPDKPLNLDGLQGFNADVDYRITELYLKEKETSTVVAHFDLHDGILTSDRFQWDGSFSAGQGEVYLNASARPLVFRLEVNGERIPFLWLLAGEPDDSGKSAYLGRLETRGVSARELAANLSGAMAFYDEGGRLDNYDMDLLLGDLLGEIIDRLNPATETRAQSQVECSAGALIVKDGLVEVVPGLILRNEKLDFVAAGSVDLNTERLDLAFSTRSRKGIGFSAGRTLTNYIKLGGTLANPRIALDPKGAAISGSAAIATAGWSILAESMWDRWVLTAGDPCKRLIKKAREDKKRDYESLWRARATN